MYHFFAEHKNVFDDHIVIGGSDFNHIHNVLRMKAGEKVMISTGDNIDYSCELAQYKEDTCCFKILQQNEKTNELPVRVTLYQGLPKGEKMELLIQKCIELGVTEIVPVSMKRCIMKLDTKKADRKIERWNTIAESAAKQSKRSIIPEVKPVMSYKLAVERAKEDGLIFVPYECADGMQKTRELLGSLKKGTHISFFIGPEGGFDLDELEYAKEAGAEIITLGRRILRTETAGLMLMSVLTYLYEE